ncbi:c-type cytochrome [Hyphococcus sp.]|jgi:mono/diheme cytochrome c family protein|uniref:c-type cytochrome n=1 Tax=Hyphococcus sp. TaxID=2038636 RepID=UPI003D0A74C5
MKNPLLILGAALPLIGGMLIVQITAQTTALAQDQPPTTTSDPASIASGAQAWANHCSRCHNLRSPSELNAELWNVSVTHMRVRANLPGSVADDIKAFLISSASDSSGYSASTAAGASTSSYAYLNPGDPVRGLEVYSQTCIACHGADGTGAIEGVPDLTLATGRLAKSSDVVLKHIINGYQSEGSLMAMPPMGGNPDLSEQDMADVLAYMRKEYKVEANDEN